MFFLSPSLEFPNSTPAAVAAPAATGYDDSLENSLGGSSS